MPLGLKVSIARGKKSRIPSNEIANPKACQLQEGDYILAQFIGKRSVQYSGPD